MKVLGLTWVGTRTTEFEATVGFFRDVLGLGVHSAEPDFTVLDVPGGATVEVFGPSSEFNHHLTHPVAGFLVDDLGAAAAELEAAGAEIVLPIQGGDPRSWLHFRAPDGFVYELAADRSRGFVPSGFDPPRELALPEFVLVPLGPEHNESDHAAWTSSIEHIRSTPGFESSDWPPADGMSLDANRSDLEGHARDFAERTGFTFTVLRPGTWEVIGCLYVYPAKDGGGAEARSWVRADVAELDGPLRAAVSLWLAEQWPFEHVVYAAPLGPEVDLGDLRAALSRVLDAAEASFGSKFDLGADYYWALDPRQAFELEPPPAEGVTAGQLSDDLAELQRVAAGADDVVIWHDLAHVVAILNRIAALDLPR